MFKFNKFSGQASKLLLVLAVVVFVAVIITFLIMRAVEKPPKLVTPIGPVTQAQVFEKTLGNIRFIYLSALDKGSVLKASEITKTQYYSYEQKDFVIDNLGAKFIKVTIGAQNTGTVQTQQGAWDIENIVDSENREFPPIEDYSVNPWLPNPNLCKALLKPAFDPTPCTKIYEVSRESAGLKIRVQTGKGNSPNNFSPGNLDEFLIDLIIK